MVSPSYCRSGVAEFGGALGLWSMAQQRFTHGRHFGDWRASQQRRSRVVSLILAPAVPFVLVLRIVRRVWRRVGERSRLFAALPALTVLSGAWALGEVFGALAGHASPRVVQRSAAD